VGFHCKGSGTGGITYPGALDEALCFGWIDGIRKKVDDSRYTIRFTPRRARSNWSLVNIRRVKQLKRLARMQPAGSRAFAARSVKRTGTYSFEQRKDPALDPVSARRLRANPAARTFFESQAPSYQRVATWWVVSARRPETRDRRLQSLIASSAARQRIASLTSPREAN
jgi:uncharacterized protein YdeI (YjbR/CyaY-like superfamily)